MAKHREWILAPLVALWCGCGGDDPPQVTILDAGIDAPPDASPDAPPPSMEIVEACMHACARIGECAGMALDPGCVTECEAGIADCTPQQVMDVDACAQSECGENGATLAMCILAIPCVGN